MLCYSCHAHSYILFINQHIYSVKCNIYWLMSWIKVKGLMDGDVWEILRIKKIKLNTINDTVPFLYWWGKSICVIAAEKHRNFHSRQYGDWGQVFIVGMDWTGRSGDGIPVGTKVYVMSRQVPVPLSILHSGQEISFLGVKRLVRGFNHPPPSSTSVKEWERSERYEASLYAVFITAFSEIGASCLCLPMDVLWNSLIIFTLSACLYSFISH
jgi:hypothetical protein